MAVIGYGRKLVGERDVKTQIEMLEEFGCAQVFADRGAVRGKRKWKELMLDSLHEGDVVAVCRLCFLGQSFRELADTLAYFKDAGVELVSIEDEVDTRGEADRAFFRDVAVIDAFMRGLTRAYGDLGGRKPVNREKIEMAIKLHDENSYAVSDACNAAGISERTYYNYKRKQRAAAQGDS